MSSNGEPWPNAGDYLEAVQNPSVSFKDPKLKASKPQTNRMGLPRTRSGNFANVYKFEHAGGAVAVRVFLYENQKRAGHYQAVADHLRKNRPKSTVEFAYDPAGIRVKRAWFPVLTMDWVDGMILGNWVEKMVQAGNRGLLRTMADRWLELFEELTRLQIAHGDLQHANVMVVKDRPVLVDYDCMSVPGLFGGLPPERGLPAYQHPLRTNPRRHDPNGKPPLLSPDLDTFSSLVIVTALRALAADLTLWDEFVTKTGNESLLFTEKDHAEPGKSRLYDRLAGSPDPDVVEWTARMREWASGPIDKYRRLDEVLVDPFRDLRSAVARKDWDAVAAAPRPKGRPLPHDLAAVVAEAARRLAARDRFRAALASRDAREVVRVRIAVAPLLNDWPAVKPLLDQADPAAATVAILDRLTACANTPGIVKEWDLHEPRLPKPPGPEVEGYRAEVELRKAISSKNWDAIVPRVYAPGRMPIPADLKSIADEGQKKGRVREQLEEAVRSGDARRAAAALAAAGTSLNDWPACAAILAEARRVAENVQALEALKAVAGTPRIVKAWDDHNAKLPRPLSPEAEGYRAEVEVRKAVPGKTWDVIVPLVYPPGRLPITTDLKAIADEGQKKGRAREQIEQAVRSKEARRAVAALTAVGTLLDDWPACAAMLAEARQIADVVLLLDQLQAAAGTPGLARLWKDNEGRLAGVREAEPLQLEARQWMDRNAKLDRLASLVRAKARLREIADAWDALQRAGGHPDEQKYRAEAQAAKHRAEAIEAIRRLVGLPESEDTDAQLVRAWDGPPLTACAEAASDRPKVDAARSRLDAVRRVEVEAARPGEGADKERQIFEAARPLTGGYAFRLAPRVVLARRRHEAFAELDRMLAGTSDLAIARAWDAAQQAGAIVTDAKKLAGCQFADRRRKALAHLSQSIPTALPVHQQDELWQKLWDDATLRPCLDARQSLARYEQAVSRLRKLAALKEALGMNDPSRVKSLVDELNHYPPLDELRPRIDAALVDLDRIRALTGALDRYTDPKAGETARQAAGAVIRMQLLRPDRPNTGPGARPATSALGPDMDFLKLYAGELNTHRAKLEQWLREQVMSRPPVAADPPYRRDPHLPRQFRVRWIWPDKLVTHHLVATNPHAQPLQAGGARVDWGALNQGGGWPVVLDGPRLFVSVWPVVKLSWGEIIGPPLQIGPITPSGRNGTGGPQQLTRPGGNPYNPMGPGGALRP
jgi:hypothetical protein